MLPAKSVRFPTYERIIGGIIMSPKEFTIKTKNLNTQQHRLQYNRVIFNEILLQSKFAESDILIFKSERFHFHFLQVFELLLRSVFF